MRATFSGSALSAASFHRLRMRLSRSTRSASASLNTADTDGALPASTNCSAYAARWGSTCDGQARLPVSHTRFIRRLGITTRRRHACGRHVVVRCPVQLKLRESWPLSWGSHGWSGHSSGSTSGFRLRFRRSAALRSPRRSRLSSGSAHQRYSRQWDVDGAAESSAIRSSSGSLSF